MHSLVEFKDEILRIVKWKCVFKTPRSVVFCHSQQYQSVGQAYLQNAFSECSWNMNRFPRHKPPASATNLTPKIQSSKCLFPPAPHISWEKFAVWKLLHKNITDTSEVSLVTLTSSIWKNSLQSNLSIITDPHRREKGEDVHVCRHAC